MFWRCYRPRVFQEVECPRFKDNRYMKVVRLSALRTGGLYPPPPGNIPGTRFYYRLSQPQGHSAAGRVMSIKNSNDTTGNRTRDLPTCSARPQTNAPPRAPFVCVCVCVCIYIYIHTHTHTNIIYIKVKQSCYRVGVAQKVPGS